MIDAVRAWKPYRQRHGQSLWPEGGLLWRRRQDCHHGPMLRVAALVAAVFAWGALPGADDPEANPDKAFRWTSAPAPGSDVETRNATADAPPTVLLRRGRIAVAADGGDRDQQVLIEAGPVAITVTSGQVLVDHVDGTCFVVVVVGSALVRGMHSQHRGILLQSRQGIASAADGALADVLTFERLPRLNDPEPLAQQASAAPRLAAHDEPWPDEVPLLAAYLPEAAAPVSEPAAEPSAGPVAEASAPLQTSHNTETSVPAVVSDVGVSDADAASDAQTPAAPATESSEAPLISVVDEPADDDADAAAPLSLSLTPAWQRRGRR